MVFLVQNHFFLSDSCRTLFKPSMCVIRRMTVSCDSCKVFLKKRPARTLEAARRKMLQAVMSVCQITYLTKHMPALQNHLLQTRILQKCQKKKRTVSFNTSVM